MTSFPLTFNQQILSFAVSPDGAQVLGSIVTLPPKPTSVDLCSAGVGPEFGVGDFSFAVYAAQAGGSGRLLYARDNGTTTLPAAQVLFLIGWDAVGPLGTTPDSNTKFGSGWSTPGGAPKHYWGVPVRVDANTGQVVSQISDQSCVVGDIAASGAHVCTQGNRAAGDISVRHPDGSEIWGQKVQPGSAPYAEDFLSPLNGRVVTSSGNRREVFCWGVCDVKLPNQLLPVGWLDDLTVIGDQTSGPGNLGYVKVDAPTSLVDLGFKGVFVGTVGA